MKSILLILLISLGIQLEALAEDGWFRDQARVIRVEPVTRRVPVLLNRRVCGPAMEREPVAASIGEDIRRQRQRWERGRCRPLQETVYRDRIDGYRVTYRYAGRTVTTTLDHDPGSELSLEVGIGVAD